MPSASADQDVFVALAQRGGNQFIVVLDAKGDDAASTGIAKGPSVGLFDGAVARAHHHCLTFLEFADRQDCGDVLALLHVDQVDDRLAFS
jgi:hypothetical protein